MLRKLRRHSRALIIYLVFGILVAAGCWLVLIGPFIQYGKAMVATLNAVNSAPCVVLFEDLNGNMRPDPGEMVLGNIPGASVQIDDPANRYAGRYSVKECRMGLASGSRHAVKLTIILPAGYTLTTPGQFEMMLETAEHWIDNPSHSALVGVQNVSITSTP